MLGRLVSRGRSPVDVTDLRRDGSNWLTLFGQRGKSSWFVLREQTMPTMKRFRCNNCGYRFENKWYPLEERPQAEREGVRFSRLHCPECNRTDIRDGWE